MSQISNNSGSIQTAFQPQGEANTHDIHTGNVIPPALQNPHTGPVPEPVVNQALQNAPDFPPANLHENPHLPGQEPTGPQNAQMNGAQPPREAARQRNADLAGTLENVLLHGGPVDGLPEPLQQVLKDCRNEVVFHYGNDVIPDDGTVISLLSPQTVKTFLNGLRALNKPATADDVKRLLMPAAREGGAVKSLQNTLNTWHSGGYPVSFGMIRPLSLEETRHIMDRHPDLLRELKNCGKPDAENSQRTILERNSNLLERIYARELFVQFAETNPEDLPNNVQNPVSKVLQDLRDKSGFTGMGNTLSKDCRDTLVPRIKAEGEAVTTEKFSAMLKEALLEEQRVAVLADKLKERWEFSHSDTIRPDSFWRSMARGVMARMARGDEAAQDKLAQLNTAASLGQMQKATFSNAVLRPFYNEAMQLAEKAEKAAQKAQDSVYARMHERTGVPLGQLREYGALDLSAAFEAIVADLLAGRIDAKDADTVFGRAADELVEKRLRRYDDASTAQVSTDVDGNTAGLWKLRVLADKTLPKAGHMEIITICNGIDGQIARDFAAAVTNGDAPDAFWKLSVFMAQFMEACDSRGVWPDTDEEAGALLRTAAEYLISRHGLGGNAGKADFIKALEEWKDLQKNTTIPEYLFGVEAAEQLLAAARATANAALANRVSQNNAGPDYQAVEKAVFAQVRAEFGSGPDSVRGLDKKTREEVLYPKIRQHDGPVTPQVYGAILREAILSGQRLSILAESLKSQWQAQGHDPALHPNDSYWTSMAAGVMERLARGDGTARASLAGLENAGTASAAKGAVASMQAALDHAIALAARIDAAAAAAQAHVYDTMARATGQKAEQIKGYRPLRLSNEFALIGTKILLGNTSEDQVDKAFMDKAKELVDRRLSFISSVDGLGLSPAVARRWKNSLLTEETPPPVPFAAIRELGDTIDLGPLREALASYRRMKDDGLSREDMRAGIQTLYDILQGLGVTAQKTLFDSNLWPKNCGADAFTQLGVYLCDYLMDRNPDLRFALLHPDLRADLESENASRSGQTDAQGFIRIGFYSGFVGVSNTRQAENEKELENLVKNANGQFRKVLGERLHIPQIYLSKAKPVGLEARAKQLADDIRAGRLPLPGEEAVFSNEAAFMTLMEQAVQVYAEAYLRVDEQGGLSEQAAAQMKDFLLTLSLPLPGGLSVADIFTVAGQTDARTFLSMLTVDNPVGAVALSWAGLVDGISRACADRIGPQQWAALSQEEKANVLSLAWMAVQAAVPGLREALADKGPGLLAGVEGSLGASNANPLIKEHFPLMRAIVNNAAGNAKSDNDRLANSLGEKANLGDMSPMNAQMLDQGILHLRERFGRQCLPDERQIVLDLRLPENGGKTLRNVLQERIRAADHGVTPRELANMTAELLLPVAQAQVAANRLRELALADGIGALHPETLAFALNTLRAVYPQMETFATLENAEGILSMLAAIPQEEVLAILRDARVMQDYSDLAMAQALSEAAGLIPGYALRLLAMNGRNMESAFGEGYRAMLSEARANPNARLTGQALADWCKDQAGKAIAPWADAINAIKASSLPAESKKVLLRRALLEADPSVLTKALAVAQKLDASGLASTLENAAVVGNDRSFIAKLADFAGQLNRAVSEAANGLPPEDAQRLLSETRQMLLALHPDLAEKLAQPANCLGPLFNLAVLAEDNGLGGLALIHAARGREASLWQMPDEDMKAIRDGSATPEQQQKLDELLLRGRALLKREQTRLNMPPDKLPYLRNLIGAVLQDPYVRDDDREPLISRRAEYLRSWEDVVPIFSGSSELAEAFRLSVQETARQYAADDSKFGEDNINTEMIRDLGRAIYIIDGRPVPRADTNSMQKLQGLRALTDAVPDPRARRFISSFMYQMVYGNLSNLFSAIPDNSGRQFHAMQGAEHMAKGAPGDPSTVLTMPQPGDESSGGEISYELRMAPDKKSALVLINIEFNMKIQSLNYGRVAFTQEIQVSLEGEPAITGFSIGQHIMPNAA